MRYNGPWEYPKAPLLANPRLSGHTRGPFRANLACRRMSWRATLVSLRVLPDGQSPSVRTRCVECGFAPQQGLRTGHALPRAEESVALLVVK